MQVQPDVSRVEGSSQENVSALLELLNPEGGEEAEGNGRPYLFRTKGEANQTGEWKPAASDRTGQNSKSRAASMPVTGGKWKCWDETQIGCGQTGLTAIAGKNK